MFCVFTVYLDSRGIQHLYVQLACIMNTPNETKRTADVGVSVSRIPRPSKKACLDEASPALGTRGTKRRHISQSQQPPAKCPDEASPGLDRGTKQRHTSQPQQPPVKKLNTTIVLEEISVHSSIPQDGIQNCHSDFNDQSTLSALEKLPVPQQQSPVSCQTIEDVQDKPRRRSKNKDGSKRRSSFVKGRISTAHLAVPSNDISLDIPADLSSEERLSRLSSAVAQSALEKVAEEFQDLNGMQQLKVKAHDAIASTVTRLQADRTFHRVTDTSQIDGVLPNPINVHNEKGIRDLQAYTHRLKQEFERWRELLEVRTQQAEQAKRTLEEASQYPIVELPAVGLTVQERLRGLENRPDLHAKLTALHQHRETITLAVSMHIQAFNQLKTFQEDASRYLEKQALKIYQTTMKTPDSPRKLISAVIDCKD